jgi:integral membrane sensor domain MASE1
MRRAFEGDVKIGSESFANLAWGEGAAKLAVLPLGLIFSEQWFARTRQSEIAFSRLLCA